MLKLSNFSNLSNRQFFGIVTRKLQTTAYCNATGNPNVEQVERRVSSPLKSYFENQGLIDIVDQAPEEYVKRNLKSRYFTVVDPKLASKIAFSICSRVSDGCVIESDPGFGFISEILVSVFPDLCLTERSNAFRDKLEVFQKQHENVRIFDFNTSTLFFMILYGQRTPFPKVSEFYEYLLPKIKLLDVPKVNWIFSIPNGSIFKTFCKVQLYDATFKGLGKMEYYITLPAELYKVLTVSHDEFHAHIAVAATLFQTIFNHEVLMRDIPRKKFLPWPGLKDATEEVILIQLIPKADVLNMLSSSQLTKSFMKFLQLGLVKGKRVIPVLESYVNNCGPLFILNHDLTVYTEFFDLAPEKLLSVFLAFSKLPEFSHSTFTDENQDEYVVEGESAKNLEIDDPVGEVTRENDTAENSVAEEFENYSK